MLLGTQAAIPDPVQDDFRATGTSHLLVISGWNISVLLAAIIGGLAALGVSPRRAALVALPVLPCAAAGLPFVPVAAGLPHAVRRIISPHKLRHSRARRMLDEGWDLGRRHGHDASPAVARLASITAIVCRRLSLGLNSTRLVPAVISGRWPGAA